MKISFNKTSIVLLLLCIVSVNAAEFCVTTSAELQSALDDANTNNQHNLIKIVEGIYQTLGSEFSYNSMDNKSGWDLEISGAWSEFMTDPCGQQSSGSPFLTTLNGIGDNRVMQIIAAGNANITISSVFFINGLVGGGFSGGGLLVFSTQNDHTGIFRLQRNAFINNKADFDSAVSVSGFTTMIVSNNLFVSNNALSAFAIALEQNDANGIYFTNNTVYDNTKSTFNGLSTGAYITASGSSNAAIYNNILWDNDHNFGSENIDLELAGDGDFYVSHNDIGMKIGVAALVDFRNISVAPKFGSGFLNFRQLPSSMLINLGMSPLTNPPIPITFEQDWALGSLDMYGRDRRQKGQVDIGSSESPYINFIFVNGFE
ncbi:MAG: hypothetical protein L3J52_00145 [Proteobacteria bacterium]|nr:hypothetical protein [Pseudomonadota bacterium]